MDFESRYEILAKISRLLAIANALSEEGVYYSMILDDHSVIVSCCSLGCGSNVKILWREASILDEVDDCLIANRLLNEIATLAEKSLLREEREQNGCNVD